MSLIKVILTIIFIAISTPLPIFAQEEEVILFWGTTCPFCHVVMDEIEELGLYELIDIEELEIYENEENLAIFQEKIAECGINPNTVGVPLLYTEGECFIGPDPIVERLISLVDGEEIEREGGERVLGEEIIDEGRGERNTRILIIGALVGLVLLVLFGIPLQKKKAQGASVILLIISLLSFSASSINAMCPVCTVAVGAGLGFSRYFGIDDVVTGVWIGGLVMSSLMWFLGWLKSKGIDSWWSKSGSFLLMYTLLGVTLYFLDFVGNPLNRLWGIDKIVLGIITGGVFFYLFGRLHLYLKEKNNDEIYLPFQKVVLTVGSLILLTAFFYVIIY